MDAGSVLSAAQYRAIGAFLERRAGIRLGGGKEYLVVSRLGHLLREHGLVGFDALLERLGSGADPGLQAAVVDAMTTNETFWFRDPAHYRILVDVLLPACAGRQLRIWSAAASTGQEPYSILFSLHEAQQRGQCPPGTRWEVLGTDISASALAQARAGRYCGVAVSRGLSADQRKRFFVEDEHGCIEVQPVFRRQVRFREFNLLDAYASLGHFDVIFCRNVLIYFSQERKRDILERMHASLTPGGALFIGSTESMSEHSDLFRMERHGSGLVYRRD